MVELPLNKMEMLAQVIESLTGFWSETGVNP